MGARNLTVPASLLFLEVLEVPLGSRDLHSSDVLIHGEPHLMARWLWFCTTESTPL